MIRLASALNFLGLPLQLSELGMMAAQGRSVLIFAPHVAVIPRR